MGFKLKCDQKLYNSSSIYTMKIICFKYFKILNFAGSRSYKFGKEEN